MLFECRWLLLPYSCKTALNEELPVSVGSASTTWCKLCQADTFILVVTHWKTVCKMFLFCKSMIVCLSLPVGDLKMGNDKGIEMITGLVRTARVLIWKSSFYKT